MKALKRSEPYEIRDEIHTLWEDNRKAILKTAAVVAGVAVVATAFFLGRARILNALVNSKIYRSGMELTHKLADAAGSLTHKAADVASTATHKVMDTAGAVTHMVSEHKGVALN